MDFLVDNLFDKLGMILNFDCNNFVVDIVDFEIAEKKFYFDYYNVYYYYYSLGHLRLVRVYQVLNIHFMMIIVKMIHNIVKHTII